MEAKTLMEENASAVGLVEMMLTPYDELVEVDTENDSVQNLKHTAEKYYVPDLVCGFRDLFRYSADHMVHPDDRERYLSENDPDRIWSCIEKAGNGAILRSRFRYRLQRGGWRWVEQVAVGGKRYGVQDKRYYAFLYDVHNEVVGVADAEYEENGFVGAERNTLTSLLTEESFFSLAPGFIKKLDEGWCVLALDVEHFKMFNEWYGRTQGDLLLARIGAELLRLEKEVKGMACYFGQDDFAIIMPEDEQRIAALYETLHELIKEQGTSVAFMPAFGTVGIDSKLTVYDLYDRASLAARRAKDDHQTRVCAFDPSMLMQTDRDYRILSDFQKALRDHELFIQMQPQCQIATTQVVGAESLVRWRKANGELVSPGVFVPVLEQYGFVTDMDKYVWEEVCRWQRKWIDEGHTPLPVSVNVSKIDIYTIDVAEFFDALIRKYALTPDVIKIEITESAYVGDAQAADTVHRLREKGFVVLMDDFGSGYSSLNMLRNLSVDIIKLDARFLRMDGDDKKGLHIMESIVNMAKTMGVPIIVEGVETQEESDFLAGLGCRYVQGYFFYRPMPVEEFEKLISDPARVDTGGFRFKAQEQFHTREFLDQNVFSDTVLNNILGPLAFYLWRGDDVDVTRFNQQFYNELKVPNFQKRMSGIQRLMPEEDVPELYQILQKAIDNPDQGARGSLRFKRPDGTISQYRVRIFFLKEDEEGKRFYGSIHDMTDLITLNDHIRLFSRVSPDSIVFARRQNNRWFNRVVIHSLKEVIGLTREEFQREIDDGTFYDRIVPSDRKRLMDCLNQSDWREKRFSLPILVTGADGTQHRISVKIFGLHDEASGVEYIMTFRAAEA